MKLFLLTWSLLASWSLGIFAEESFDETVKKIDLQLEEEALAFVCLPVASGEAMLVKNASGQTVLINTGGRGSIKQIKTWLERLHVRKINKILLTNNDKDISSSFAFYKEKYGAREVIAGKNQKGVTTVWKEGERHLLLPNVTADVLNVHDGALTLRFQYGRLCMLYMASDQPAVVKSLIHIPLKNVNILKVANFAKHDHLSTAFLKRVDPQAAIIFPKQGIHPNEHLLEKLYQLWIDIYQIDKVGIMMIKCNLTHYKIITF
ncbi:ComEC/Rec2 family competence protein [Thermaerobacillus caldiproteolyticus]|uniref:Beta-lactamase superfamily II metal-dependent hydrolase n=1 Tax=Thermaerobacillus caldiproteolyticus TaxID=247480 RepID=A0A7W0BYZ2_9BACL|nr:hypothetical protein [Anoxybacillus caldiproteolyticus]MBA2875065.1 beta-lactamase superfamily II metal-dependent hydrolase [Anoxybacillus caldiproteolyticus]QPA32957.1 hypothetical protein ISX45_08840 [Anoxybacillus caldiproteolyticus]